ncbi:hypothetical protein DMH04_30765 [Kibdelosporangium aridum]|uniref:Uncharacterized protein n=1 Tax=Kibdelosporangium aridum TaxID=2030 RepID=A0A428Z2M8_KIBAR|nr:hypothetical protein [Kibdelosporangium aridum]RSM79984.1 hypothetical protein DMH04_30765 [Kibdelosporangium aridum]
MTVNYQELFDAVHKRPLMFGLDGSYSSYCAFMMGCDAGNGFCLLHGFREWLVLRLEKGANFSWQVLVLELALPDNQLESPSDPLDSETNSVVVGALFDLLREFFQDRESRGLVKIMGEYIELTSARNGV